MPGIVVYFSANTNYRGAPLSGNSTCTPVNLVMPIACVEAVTLNSLAGVNIIIFILFLFFSFVLF